MKALDFPNLFGIGCEQRLAARALRTGAVSPYFNLALALSLTPTLLSPH